MIIKYGPTVVGARGTLGGSTFSANGGGPYVKIWSRGANPKSALQSAQRGIFGEWASGWRALTSAQRDDWDDYADDAPQELTNSLGETYFASGFNWYVRINTHLAIAGAADRVDAPTLTRPLAPIIQLAEFRVTTDPLTSFIVYTVADPDLTALHTVFGRVFNSLGRRAASSNFTFLAIAVPNVFRAIDLDPPILASFGPTILGQKLFLQSQIQDAHGQRGPIDSINLPSEDP